MNALRSTVARASIRATQRVQKRQMGSGAAAPEWTGIDKIVRDKFPEDYQGEFHQGLRLSCGSDMCYTRHHLEMRWAKKITCLIEEVDSM